MAATRRTKGKAGTWQTRFGGVAKADTRQMADKFWGHGQSGLKRRTQGGRMAEKVWRRGQSGLKADTSGHRGRGQSISRPVFS